MIYLFIYLYDGFVALIQHHHLYDIFIYFYDEFVALVQVADFETSQEDHCKLFINTNVNGIVYRVKTETTYASFIRTSLSLSLIFSRPTPC